MNQPTDYNKVREAILDEHRREEWALAREMHITEVTPVSYAWNWPSSAERAEQRQLLRKEYDKRQHTSRIGAVRGA